MPAVLDGSCLVHADVAARGGDGALIGAEERVNDDGVRLGASHKEMHGRLRSAAGLPDFPPGALRELIRAVSGR